MIDVAKTHLFFTPFPDLIPNIANVTAKNNPTNEVEIGEDAALGELLPKSWITSEPIAMRDIWKQKREISFSWNWLSFMVFSRIAQLGPVVNRYHMNMACLGKGFDSPQVHNI